MKSSLLFSLLLPVIVLLSSADHKMVNYPSPEINNTGSALEFTDANFQSKVLSSGKLTLVDFWAEWCGPCRAMGPVVEKLSDEYEGKVNIGKLNVDHNPNITNQYGISSIPTLLFIKNGKVVCKLVGVYPKSKIEKKIKEFM
jgi:thioredoxin 1